MLGREQACNHTVSLDVMEGHQLSAALNSVIPHDAWESYIMVMLHPIAIQEPNMLLLLKKRTHNMKCLVYTLYFGALPSQN